MNHSAPSRILLGLAFTALPLLGACAAADGGSAYSGDAGILATDGGSAPKADAGHKDATPFPSCFPGDPSCSSTPDAPDGGAKQAADGGDTDYSSSGGDFGDDAGAGKVVSCAFVNDCMGSTNLGAVKGDDGADSLTAQGHESRWFTFRVNESSSGYGDTKFTATLLSPSGANYDIYAYVNTDSDVVECSVPKASSTNGPGSSDKINLAWGSAFYDDSRTVRIEVRHVSGTACTNDEWTLFVEGNR